MGFHEVRHPTDIDFGSDGGPGFEHYVLRADSRQERRVARSSKALHTFDLAYDIKTHATLAAAKAFYLARGGLSNGFRYKDWADYNTSPRGRAWGQASADPASDDSGQAHSATDQVLGVGDGSNQSFQLVKRYEDDAGSYIRTLKKPVEGTVLLAIDGVEIDEGVDFTVNHATGVVVITPAPASDEVVTGGCEFDVPVRYGEEVDKQFAAALSSHGHGEIGTIPLVEILEPESSAEDVRFNGSRQITTAVDFDLDLGHGCWAVEVSSGSPKARLPDLDDVPNGFPLFALFVDAGANILDIRDSAGVMVDQITGTRNVILAVAPDSAGARKWYVLG